jgi:hypothetical protein
MSIPRLGDTISVAISHHPTIRDGHPLFQFSTLLHKLPASQSDLLSEGPIVVVLDPLDECGNAEDREVLLEVLTDEFAKLPPMHQYSASQAERQLRSYTERHRKIHLRKIGRKMMRL